MIGTQTETAARAAPAGLPKRIDLNADVAEGDDDEPLFEIVSSVNIACGAHAGDERMMRRALDLAATFGVAAGAHPGYPDRASMGRAPQDLSGAAVEILVTQQVQALERLGEELEVPLCHVKPHGALYNQAAANDALALAVANGVRKADPMLRLVGLAGSTLLSAGASLRLTVAGEGFADRRYLSDGTLTPRARPDAVITDPAAAALQAVAIATGRPFPCADDGELTVEAQTICVHGDTPGAVEIARAVRIALEAEGFEIVPL